MINNQSKKILEQSFANLLPELVDYIVSHNEQSKALELSKILEKTISENINELRLQPKLSDFYQKIILKLKFVCLPVLDDKDVISLVKDNFCFQLEIKDYNFFDKLNAKLLGIIVVEDRNNLKEDLKKAILENNERITPNHNIKIVKDWIKNYLSNIGLDRADNLTRAQYFMNLRDDKNISSKEHSNLLALFKFYNILNTPSDSPEGFEEEYPIMINGQLNIFRKGVLEPVPNNKAVDEVLALLKEGGNTEPAKKMVNITSRINEEDDDLFLPAKSPAAEKIDEYSRDLFELEQSLKNYPESSLEHKAISQEISRLKKSEFKQSQKADVN